MNENDFTKIKNIFIDNDEVFDFVNLDKSVITYRKLITALQKPLKLILFFGKPGTGKTFVLNKIYKDLVDKQKIILIPQPYFTETDFFSALYEKIFKTKKKIDNYENFLTLYKEKANIDENEILKNQVSIMLDEAQLYPIKLIEIVRLMADTRYFKFLFTIHKTGKEDILAKDYFKTRIWETVELPNSTKEEVGIYLKEKLNNHNFSNYYSMFKNSHINFLYKVTNGNLRTLNKILYKIFEILEYYQANEPTAFNNSKKIQKILEMAAIESELLSA